MATFTRHPLSALFARYDMDEGNLHLLSEDIKDNGQLLPITLHEGMILDGWNRYRACELAAVAPVTMDLAPGLDPWEFVKGVNMLRRHMTPAERVAVLASKSQMDGINVSVGDSRSKLTTRQIQNDLEVSRGTAVKAGQIIRANDPALNEALAEKRVSLAEAADLAKLPEPERKAALEHPEPKPLKPKSEATAERVAELEALLAEREDECRELISEAAASNDEYQSMLRIIEADDRLAQAHAEVKRFTELNRVLQERLNGKMTECHGLAKDAKRWMNKFLALERKFKALDRDETSERGA